MVKKRLEWTAVEEHIVERKLLGLVIGFAGFPLILKFLKIRNYFLILTTKRPFSKPAQVSWYQDVYCVTSYCLRHAETVSPNFFFYSILRWSVAVSTMRRQSSRIAAFLQTDARPMFCWPRSASTAWNQVWLGLPGGRFQSGGSPRIIAATARWWSSCGELRAICPKSRKRLSVTRWERGRHPVVALTSTFVTWRYRPIITSVSADYHLHTWWPLVATWEGWRHWGGDRFISLWLFSSFGRLFFKFSQCLFEGVWFITFVVHMIDKQFMINLF